MSRVGDAGGLEGLDELGHVGGVGVERLAGGRALGGDAGINDRGVGRGDDFADARDGDDAGRDGDLWAKAGKASAAVRAKGMRAASDAAHGSLLIDCGRVCQRSVVVL